MEHVDHVAEVKEGVIDCNNIHFSSIKSSLGTRPPNMAKSVYSNLHHHLSGTWLALHQKMHLSVKWERAESLSSFVSNFVYLTPFLFL